MTRTFDRATAAAFLPIIKALAEGKRVECTPDGGTFFHITNPDLGMPPENYRVVETHSYRLALLITMDGYEVRVANSARAEQIIADDEAFVHWLGDWQQRRVPRA